MGWLGLSFGITLIVLLVIHWQNREDNWRTPFKQWINKDDYLLGGVMGMVLSMLVVGLFLGMYSIVQDGRDITAEGCVEVTHRWDIVSAVREKNHSSSFILGTGGGHTVDTYYVYRVESKGLMLSDYPATRTYIVEQDGSPKYERVDTVCPMPVYDFLWWSSGNTFSNINRFGTLYVPTDTILREFKL